MVKFGLCGPISDFCQHNLNFDEREVRDPLQKKQVFRGVKMKKSCPTFFCGLVIHRKNTLCKKNGSKRPFQPSAVTRAIYRRLYGVATTNQMIKIEIQISITEII